MPVQPTRRSFVSGAILATAAVAGALRGCAPVAGDGGTDHADAPATLQSTFFAFNTACVIGGVVSRTALDAAVARCKEFERLLSRTIVTSDVSRVNAASGAVTEVDPATAELVAAALAYRDASGGTFDPTIGAVSELWDFVSGVVPDEAAIAAALPHVGTDVVVDLAGSTVTMADPAARLDLGGIAKGFVTDAIIEDLAATGTGSAYVNLGGNVAVLGGRPDGAPWSVGVRSPFADGNGPAGDAQGQTSSSDGPLVARIDVTDGSVVTSGLYERGFEQAGRRYWHILDPSTGYPVDTELVSVTIASARSLDGDGYTKPPFFLGVEDGLAFLSSHDLEALVVTMDGRVAATPGSGFVTAGRDAWRASPQA